jgi:hypothetical protein
MFICDNISLNSSSNEKCFRHKLKRNSKQAFYVKSLFPEIHAVHEMLEKYGTAREATDDNTYGACALHAG